MQKIIAATPAQDDGDHIPLIVDQNPQVPSRIRHLIEGAGDDPAPVLAAMARRLQSAGATALAMPCNTAHHYAPAIRAATTIPFIDMVAISVAHAAALAGKGGQIGILASPAVRKVGLFNAACSAADLRATYPDDEEAMLATIRGIKAQGATETGCRALRRASTRLFEQGAVVQMIACTEFSLIADATDPRAVAFDTLDQLVGGIIAFATSGAKGQSKANLQSPTQGAPAPIPRPNKETTS